MYIKKSVKKNRFKRGVFITITIMIAIGLVIPLAGLFQKQPDPTGTQGAGPAGQTPQERIAALEGKVKENPGDTTVLMDLGQAYLYSGKPDQAIQTYQQVLAVNPNLTEAYLDMATIYFYSSKHDQAIAQLQELLKKEPDNVSAHYLYGIVLGTGKKDYAAGIQEMEKFIALAKEGPDVEKARQIINEWKAAPAQQ